MPRSCPATLGAKVPSPSSLAAMLRPHEPDDPISGVGLGVQVPGDRIDTRALIRVPLGWFEMARRAEGRDHRSQSLLGVARPPAMTILRTPDARFSDLPGYPFVPRYTELSGGLRMHHVDEGPRDAAPILMLHGEPSWSFLYRKMIPIFAGSGFRAVAPDLIGFGRSDKPEDPDAYTYAAHVAWITEWLEACDLQDVTLVCQDWGSLIGLRVAAERSARIGRIVVANGYLPTGRDGVPWAFRLWRAFAARSPLFPVGRIVAAGCVSKLSRDVVAAYDAPFPSRRYQAGARRFPALVPTSPDDPAVPANRAAWEVLGRWEKPFLTLFGKNDPILGHADRLLQAHVPGAKGQPHERFWGGHFVQEDRGDHLAARILAWLERLGHRPRLVAK